MCPSVEICYRDFIWMYGKACIKIQDGFDFLSLGFLQAILKYAYLCHGWEMILKIQMLQKLFISWQKPNEFTTSNKLRWHLIEFWGKIYKKIGKLVLPFLLKITDYFLEMMFLLMQITVYFTTNSHS